MTNKTKFKVGDIVETRYGKGEVVFIGKTKSPYLVSHFEWDEGHNGESCGGPKHLTGNHCWWFEAELIKKVKENKVFPRIEITTNGKEVCAYFKKHGERRRKATARCNPQDKFDYYTGAKLALERLFEEDKPKPYNARIVCIEGGFLFKKGKIYEVKDGTLISDNPDIVYGSKGSSRYFVSLDEINESLTSQFIEVVE